MDDDSDVHTVECILAERDLGDGVGTEYLIRIPKVRSLRRGLLRSSSPTQGRHSRGIQKEHCASQGIK